MAGAGEGLADRLRETWRTRWPVVVLIGAAWYFDTRLQGVTLVGLGVASIAVAGVLFRRELGQVLAAPMGAVPPSYRRLLIVGVPVALLYLTRWSGTQPRSLALLTVAVPLGLAFAAAAERERIDRTLGGLLAARNRLLPKPARLGLALGAPVLLAFLVAHGSLADLPALFGGQTRNPTVAGSTGSGALILLTAVLSVAAAFLLLHEPQRRDTR